MFLGYLNGKCQMKEIVLMAIVLVSPLSVYAQSLYTLYDVDFSSPLHTVGEPPARGDGPAPRRTPTGIGFGSPVVVDALGELDDQPLRFEVDPANSPHFAQLILVLREFYDSPMEKFSGYRIEMDVMIESLSEDRLTILLDTPSVRNVYFNPDGTVEQRGSFPSTIIGSYSLGKSLRLRIDVALDPPGWDIWLDGEYRHNSLFSRPEEFDGLKSIRISLSDSLDRGNVAAIDNVKVYGISDYPMINLLSPQGGQGMQVGSSYDIQWNASLDVNDVMIEYSVDEGVMWKETNPPNQGNTGSYEWLVPDEPCDRCFIRVSDRGSSADRLSYGPFRIYPPQPPPAQSELFVLGKDFAPMLGLVKVNDKNQVLSGGWLWENEVAIRLEHPSARDINNNGQVVFDDAIYDDGDIVDIFPEGIHYSYSAQALNDHGQIAGTFHEYGWGVDSYHVFMLEGYAIEVMGDFGKYLADLSINNAGQIAGTYGLEGGWDTRAFLLKDGVKTDLMSLGGANCEAMDINDSNMVVGNAQTAGYYPTYHACLWTDDQVIDLGGLGGDYSGAVAINDHGHVVGYSDLTADMFAERHPFLWTGGELIDVYDLIPAFEQWNYCSVRDINNNGWIVGNGVHPDLDWRSFILAPVTNAQPAYLKITLPEYMHRNTVDEIRATVFYEDGRPSDVTANVAWVIEPEDLLSIENETELHAHDTAVTRHVRIQADLTIEGQAFSDAVMLEVHAPTTYRVPSEYPTIQDAVDACRDGDTIIVADDVYTGEGNRDIDFYNLAIVIISENGPENCIIDPNGIVGNPHRAFYVGGGAWIEGFTIRNGCEYIGVAITGKNVTIKNCVFLNNKAYAGTGGAIAAENPIIANCAFFNNYAARSGGALYAPGGEIHCTISTVGKTSPMTILPDRG